MWRCKSGETAPRTGTRLPFWQYALCVVWGIAALLPCAVAVGTVHGASFADSAFERIWRRTDAPVRAGVATRTWVWGPEARTGGEMEAYREAPGGTRLVQYFDKSRMELTDPRRDANDPYYVTNGLLALELVTGQLQLGDAAFEAHLSSAIPVAGDADDPNGPTYTTFGRVRSLPALNRDTAITATLARDGTVGDDPRLAGKATAREYVRETKHTVADVFWAFMNASGPVDGGATEPLFRSPFYATGLPISEAYWATVRVAGEPRTVLIQIFERRALTFTPGNPIGFTVEAGNVGLHYRAWRSGLSGPAAASTPASATARGATAASIAAPQTSSSTPSLVALITEVVPGGTGGDAAPERITILNGTDGPLNLTGWTLRDTRDHVYTFDPTTLSVDSSVTVHSGKGTDTNHDRYWNQPTALLNATGPETITLHDVTGNLVDSYPYP